MGIKLGFFTFAAVAVISAVACNENPASGPKTTVPPATQGGMIKGTVNPLTNQVTFEPVGSMASFSGGVSPANYGNQGVTVLLSGVVDSVITYSTSRKVWYVHMAMQNLVGWPIGSNRGTAASADTSGAFLFLYGGNPIVTGPLPCTGCTVTLANYMGSTNFNASGQQYFWYHVRLQNNQATLVSDTSKRNNPQWQFQANSDQVNSFTFVLMMNSDWAPPHESSWSVNYVAATDSLPDDNASPDWHEYAVAGDPTLGIDTMRAGVLVLTAQVPNSSIYQARNDSLGIMSATLNVTMTDSAAASTNYEGIFGIVEGVPVTGHQMFVGIVDDKVDFVTFTEGTGNWTAISGKSCTSALCKPNTIGLYHNYSLRKYANDSVSLCINGKEVLTAVWVVPAQVQTASFNAATMVFGVKGAQSGTNRLTTFWTNVSYTIGSALPGTIDAGGPGVGVCH